MFRFRFKSVWLPASAAIAFLLPFSGCSRNSHPDVQMAVYDTLNQHDLRSLTVSQDRGAGTITLSGVVGSADRKQRAEQLARQAAPGYSVIDSIRVEDAGLGAEMKAAQVDSRLDNDIQAHYKAILSEHPGLGKIQCFSYNQTLTLKGSVKTYKEREEAENLAKKVPQVQHVVNQIEINSSKPAPANS